MKFIKKIFLVSILSTIFTAFSEDWIKQFTDSIDLFNSTVKNIENGFVDFSKDFSLTIPVSTAQQNVWADAYIGKLFPSVPVHFGLGLNTSITKLDTSGLANVVKVFDFDELKDSYYLPYASVDLRLGGILFPFDLGFMFTKTGNINIDANEFDINIDLLTLGFDFRYAILKGNLILPKWSIGFGYIYNNWNLGLGNKDVQADFEYKLQTMFFETQISKTFLIFTPFIGFKALVTKSNSSFDWNLKGAVYNKVALYNIGNFVRTSGHYSYESDEFSFSEIQPVFFAGCGLKLLFLQATLSVSADLKHFDDKKLWGGAFSLRFKL